MLAANQTRERAQVRSRGHRREPRSPDRDRVVQLPPGPPDGAVRDPVLRWRASRTRRASDSGWSGSCSPCSPLTGPISPPGRKRCVSGCGYDPAPPHLDTRLPTQPPARRRPDLAGDELLRRPLDRGAARVRPRSRAGPRLHAVGRLRGRPVAVLQVPPRGPASVVRARGRTR